MESINISNELQEEDIQNIYPNNYVDHLNNRNHPHLSIDSSMYREYIKNVVKEFIDV